MRHESDKARAKRLEVQEEWFKLNPPSRSGWWSCYLQIASNCYKWVSYDTIVLEHVDSKVRRPDRKFLVENLKAACPPCNKMKGSLSLADIALMLK